MTTTTKCFNELLCWLRVRFRQDEDQKKSPWMSERQLAAYWQLYDEQGELSLTEIREWSASLVKSTGFYTCMGPHKRYHKDVADGRAWKACQLDDATLYRYLGDAFRVHIGKMLFLMPSTGGLL